jgi:hypothetical protein
VHDELDELLSEFLPVLPGLGIALELGLGLLCGLAAGLLPEIISWTTATNCSAPDRLLQIHDWAHIQ